MIRKVQSKHVSASIEYPEKRSTSWFAQKVVNVKSPLMPGSCSKIVEGKPVDSLSTFSLLAASLLIAPRGEERSLAIAASSDADQELIAEESVA